MKKNEVIKNLTNNKFYDIIKNIKIYVIVFAILELLDLVTTLFGLELGLVEANPLVYKIGWVATIIIKLLAIIICSILLQVLHIKKTFIVIIIFIPFVTVLWNLLNIVLCYV